MENNSFGISPIEMNNVLLILIANKLGISPAEILSACTLYIETQQTIQMMGDDEQGGANA
jgi:hypothetical protein